MISFNWCSLGGFALVMMLFPGAVVAQTTARSFDKFEESALAAKANLFFAPANPLPADKTALSRGTKIAIGASIGGGIGAVFGEYVFGRQMDLPHGPDMLLGAGMGAGVGALIAWLLTDGSDSNSKSTVRAAPFVSASRKALLVTLALK